MKIEVCDLYEEAQNKIEKLQNKRKSRKYILKNTRKGKLGINFEKISLVAGNMI